MFLPMSLPVKQDFRLKGSPISRTTNGTRNTSAAAPAREATPLKNVRYSRISDIST
jgi:hypothetical protein